MGTEVIKQRLTLLSIMSLWMGVVTNNTDDPNEHSLTDLKCVQEFSVQLDNCVVDFLSLHQQLGLFHGGKSKISVIYISVHRELYCRQYIQSLQCVHDNLSSCSTDTTTSLVQQKLSQLWALTANKICHINDKSSDKTDTNDIHRVLPDQIHELFKDDPVHILEESVLPHDCTGKTLFENAFIDTDENTNEISKELSDTDVNGIGVKQETEHEESIGENQSTTSKLDYVASKFDPLLQFLSYLFSPIKLSTRSTNFDENPKPLIIENKNSTTKSSKLKNMKVKYETVLLKKLKITNMEMANRDSVLDESNKQTVAKPRNYDKLKDKVIKEFEISAENRKIKNKETKITTYKWKTRIKGILQ